MLPSLSTSMFSAAGTLGRPGMVRTLPVSATTKWAPAETFELTHRDAEVLRSAGALALSLKLYCVLATHAGRLQSRSQRNSAGGRLAAGMQKVNAVTRGRSWWQPPPPGASATSAPSS